MSGFKPIICLDFDGVIHSYTSGWLGAREIPDPPVPGAINAIINYTDDFRVHIYSSRSNHFGGRRAMKKWLKKHLLRYFYNVQEIELSDRFYEDHLSFIDEDQTRQIMRKIKWPLRKPAAMLTLDDRAIQFEGAWPSAKTILTFKPWYKK